MHLKQSSHVVAKMVVQIVSIASFSKEVFLMRMVGIRSAYCKEGNVVSSKLGAQIVIRGILGLPIDMDSIPDPPESLVDPPQSIIEARPIDAVEGVEVEYYVD